MLPCVVVGIVDTNALDMSSFVNVQVHHKDSQPLEVMKLLTIYVMETSRVICDYPMDTVCIVFNLENFTMANMASRVSSIPKICVLTVPVLSLGL